MKKTPLLNAALSEVIAGLGHKDMILIGDAGMPIPEGPRRIDLALTRGVPGFLETLRVVTLEMQVESIVLADELEDASPHILAGIREILPGIPVQSIKHDELKKLSAQARAAVRTGEFTPYANIILVAGVVF